MTGIIKYKSISVILAGLLCSSIATSSELTHEFKNPSFSGQGFGNHVLTIEQIENQRRKEIREKREADAAKAKREADSTTLAKFLNNVESRIYATISKQLVDNMFGGSENSGTVQLQGATISWIKDVSTDMITLTVVEDTGTTTVLTVPIGTWAF